MRRRVSIFALFAGWFCASGAMLDMAQGFAWARMFTQYAATVSLSEAAADTLDGTRPCEICRAVQHAREQHAGNSETSAPEAVKVVLALHQAEPSVVATERDSWPRPIATSPIARREPVPVPPPRGAGLTWVA